MAAQLFTFPLELGFDATSVLHSGWKIFFYAQGTTTESAVYSDSGLTIQHAQPVTIARDGALPTIYIDDTVQYTISVLDENRNERHELDYDYPDIINSLRSTADQIFGLASPSQSDAAANKAYVDDQHEISWTPDTITLDTTVPSNNTGVSFGSTVTVDSGVTVTVGSGATWIIGIL